MVVFGSLFGEYLGINDKLGRLWFWFGHQGSEYLDLGRFWQLLLAAGLIFWLFLMFRALKPAMKSPGKRELSALFLYAAVAIPVFYLPALFYGPHSNFAVIDNWRFWIIHLWALLLGAADRCDDLHPAAVLKELNASLRNSGIEGFTTCLCADLSSSGVLLIANAGQLPPYRNGQEIEIPVGLPLGVEASAEYAETSLQLAPGDKLTFLSDGVVEARNAVGELFGFERTRQLSSRAAQQIADAAVQFGQQDDITVLTLSLAARPSIA